MADYIKTVIASCQAGHDYTTRQMAVLAVVGRGKNSPPKRFKEVAVELGISKPAVTRASQRLEEDKLLRRVETPTDRRQVDLALTDAGKAFLALAHAGFPAAAAA